MRNLTGLAAAMALLISSNSGRADDQADLQALVSKAIKAHGGEENLGKFKAITVKMKGTVNTNGMAIDFTADVSYQMPAQLKNATDVEVNGMKFTVVQVYNGDKGWVKVNDNVMEMEKDAVTEAREQLHAQWITSTLLPLKDKAYKLTSAGEMKIDGKEAVGLLASHKDYRDITLFFDKKTGLLLKGEWRAKDFQNGGQEYTAENFYSDYKDFGSVRRATKLKQKRDAKDFLEVEFTDYQGHEKLDDSVFAKP